jgi:hypothetical protein
MGTEEENPVSLLHHVAKDFPYKWKAKKIISKMCCLETATFIINLITD